MSDIEEHRKKIEEITLEMIKLLKTRTNIAKQIGDAKASLGMTVTDEEREDALRNQVTKLCKEIDLDQSTALKFLNFLFNESVKVQSDNKQTHLSVFLKAKALDFFILPAIAFSGHLTSFVYIDLSDCLVA